MDMNGDLSIFYFTSYGPTRFFINFANVIGYVEALHLHRGLLHGNVFLIELPYLLDGLLS